MKNFLISLAKQTNTHLKTTKLITPTPNKFKSSEQLPDPNNCLRIRAPTHLAHPPEMHPAEPEAPVVPNLDRICTSRREIGHPVDLQPGNRPVHGHRPASAAFSVHDEAGDPERALANERGRRALPERRLGGAPAALELWFWRWRGREAALHLREAHARGRFRVGVVGGCEFGLAFRGCWLDTLRICVSGIRRILRHAPFSTPGRLGNGKSAHLLSGVLIPLRLRFSHVLRALGGPGRGHRPPRAQNKIPGPRRRQFSTERLILSLLRNLLELGLVSRFGCGLDRSRTVPAKVRPRLLQIKPLLRTRPLGPGDEPGASTALETLPALGGGCRKIRTSRVGFRELRVALRTRLLVCVSLCKSLPHLEVRGAHCRRLVSCACVLTIAAYLYRI